MGHSGTSIKKAKAIESILSGATMQDAANAAGVSRSTLYRWLDDDDFVDELNMAKSYLISGISQRLISLAAKGVGVLAEVLSQSDTSPNLKVRIADLALGRAVQYQQVAEIERRLCILEEVNHAELQPKDQQT